MNMPDTRASLILRLPDATDIQAWDEFVSIYQPLVYRLARRQGFQHADAQELVQEVMLAVSRAVDRWEPDPKLGRFRDWLFRIARNLMINFMTRRKHRSLGTGTSAMVEFLHQQSDPTSNDPASNESALFDLEYRREIFQRVADRVRGEVQKNTWEAFWRSSVEGLSVKEVSRQLGMTVGSVYIARSRVMSKLRERAARFEQT